MEYYSATKKNEIMLFATWLDLESGILSEVKQRRRNITGHPFYVESKKEMIQMSLFTKQKQAHRLRE